MFLIFCIKVGWAMSCCSIAHVVKPLQWLAVQPATSMATLLSLMARCGADCSNDYVGAASHLGQKQEKKTQMTAVFFQIFLTRLSKYFRFVFRKTKFTCIEARCFVTGRYPS